MMKRLLHSTPLQIGLLTVAFAAIYPLVRSLPDTECAFLHYDYVGETDAGAEYCGTDAATFIDLTRLSFPVSMSLLQNGEARMGEPAFFTLSFLTAGGKPLQPWELAVVHTEKIHLLAVDESLEDYHHVHPEPVGGTGQYTFELTPARAGTYKMFAEIVPLASKSAVVTEGSFTVAGIPERPEPKVSKQSEVDEYLFSLEFDNGEPVLDAENRLGLAITRPGDGEPVALEEIMGAYAHMVAFDEDRRGFAHMHPLGGGEGIGSPEARFGFSLTTDTPGYYKVWAQVKIAGEEVFAPFDIIVQ